jgi:hypothetical protein
MLELFEQYSNTIPTPLSRKEWNPEPKVLFCLLLSHPVFSCLLLSSTVSSCLILSHLVLACLILS